MSLYPKVPINTKHVDTHNTNMDRLINTRGVKPEDIANLKKLYSGDAKKEYRLKTLQMLMEITHNWMRVYDLKTPNKNSIGDRIKFTMALESVKNMIYARMARDQEYYDDETVTDRLTMEKCQEKLVILKSSKQWLNKKQLDDYFDETE